MANPLAGASTTTHSIAVAVGLIVGFMQLPQVQAIVGPFLGAHPQVSTIGAGLAAVVALYFKPQATPPAGG